MDDEQQSIRDWADKIVGLDIDTINAILRSLKELAADRRLKLSDREFAQLQVRSIGQARKRAKKLADSPEN